MDCFHNRINLNKYLYPNRITEPYFSSVQAILSKTVRTPNPYAHCSKTILCGVFY
nr:MAG TPA: hypothetical protein [Caudoviricetes sp.]DAJ10256.1 MAG TPA: hypothetical protein [Caudoviricetes sp.]DAM04974.1 MAG TPA: hypothetical protein [Caudoviricetes sp.]DAR39357.1 MAG TPA: hypothetical protein [Caudoviricetes sp.]